MTPGLVINAIRLLVLPLHFLLDGPRFRPCRRIFHPHCVLECIRVDTSPALDQVQIFTRALEVCFSREISHVNHQRLALPVTTRVPPPLADVTRKMRAPVHGNHTIPSLPLGHIIENLYRSGRLYNSTEPTKIRQVARHTTLTQAAVLRTVGPIDRTTD